VIEKASLSSAALVPHKPLTPSSRFTVKLTARVDDALLNREATFQTGRA
jgi:hypothetical protein